MMDMKRRARSLLAVAVGACVCMHFGADYNDFEGAFVGGVQASRSSLLASSTATAESKQSSMRSSRTERGPLVQLRAAKKATGDTIMHGDTVYIKVMTGRYVGELDGTTKLEWVKARGTKKDKEHALTIEKMNNRDEPIKNGDVVMFVMPSQVCTWTSSEVQFVPGTMTLEGSGRKLPSSNRMEGRSILEIRSSCEDIKESIWMRTPWSVPQMER
ncbi:unnamed protein product [Effrenium voratum]|nr:unnamed protein product [Effrenium voratum]